MATRGIATLVAWLSLTASSSAALVALAPRAAIAPGIGVVPPAVTPIAPVPAVAPVVRQWRSHDHHVHLLGPDLLRDWKALGVTFSRPDSAYLVADGILGAAAGAGAGVDRALLVPMAHLYGNEEFRAEMNLSLDEERRRVAAENDHVAREAARHPGRAAALCSASVLRPYALEEFQRCRREHRVAGIKLHLGNSGVDLRQDAHLRQVAGIARWAESEGLPILLHLDPQRRGHQTGDVTRFARVVLEPHPRLTVIVAHLGGSGGYGPWTRSVFGALREWLTERSVAKAAAPLLWFDLSAVLLEKESEGVPATTPEQAQQLAADLRAFGFDRLLFGSDAPVFTPGRTAELLAELAGLAPNEVATIRGNTVPGLFAE